MRKALITFALVLGAGTAAAEAPAAGNVAKPPGGWWRIGNRPIFCQEGYRFEPRVRDLRYAPGAATLPGGGMGQREALPVLPAYRDGYFRLPGGRN